MYTKKLNIQTSVDLEDAMLFITLLRSFIEGLVSPNSFLKGIFLIAEKVRFEKFHNVDTLLVEVAFVSLNSET